MFDKELIEGPPTPAVAAAAAGVHVHTLDREDAMSLVMSCERLIRMYQGLQAEAMTKAAGPQPETDAESDGEPLDEDAEELAVGLGGSRQFQLARIDAARFLQAWLPLTSSALRSGELGWYEASLIVRTAEQLTDPAKIARLEQSVVPRGPFDLARRLRRALARLDPAAVRQKAEQRRVERGLRFSKDMFGSGAAQLRADGPSHLMALLAAAIDLEAKERQPGDCRTIATRRFDVLIDWAQEKLGRTQDRDLDDPAEPGTASAPVEVALADGHSPHEVALPVGQSRDEVAPQESQPEGVALADGHLVEGETAPPNGGAPNVSRRRACGSCGRSGPPRTPINVTVSLDTLLGLRDDPAELAGWGLIDADTARELAADGEWRRWLVEEGSGRLLDVGSATYRPNARMERFVRARDRTCRWPNCHQPAVRCDLDHTVAFHTEGGSTCSGNLTALCRRHHRVKHETDWSYFVRHDGWVVWISPSGRRYLRAPEQHENLDWLYEDATAATTAGRPAEPASATAAAAPPPF